VRGPSQLSRPGSHKRPLVGLLLSLLLHLLIWLVWYSDENRLMVENPRRSLRVRLTERKPDVQLETTQPPSPERHTTIWRSPGRSTFPSPAVAVPAERQVTTNLPNGETLAAKAKAQIDMDSRRHMLDPMFAPPARSGTPTLSQLERALNVPVVGETRIGDRLYQFTTVGGRRFCISVPPDIDLANNDLPVPAHSLVPTNCP